jgi:hypothetical protein
MSDSKIPPIIIVNASPRAKGTSIMLAGLCKKFLESCGRSVPIVSLYQNMDNDSMLDTVLTADTVVICGPCYVNTYPAPLIKFLAEWDDRSSHCQTIYGMIQGGMPYTHTHKSGLNMLEIFAEKTGHRYNGGFILGLGAMLNGGEIDKLPNGKKVKRQLDVFFSNVRDGKLSGNEVYEKAKMKVPVMLSRILVLLMNRKIDKKFKTNGMNAYAESPYKFDELKAMN